MKWLSRLSALFFGLITLGMIKDFVDKNRILIINSDNEDIEFEEENLRNIKDLKPEELNKLYQKHH